MTTSAGTAQGHTSLKAVIERCLRKEPGRRYLTAAELRAALGEANSAGVPYPRRVAIGVWTLAAMAGS